MVFIDRGEIQLNGKDGQYRSRSSVPGWSGRKSALSSRLGYEQGKSYRRFIANFRSRSHPKTESAVAGDIALEIPRDRAGTFAPTLVPKRTRRTGGLDEMIISLYAGGMTVREISYHLETPVGTQLSRDAIGKIIDKVFEEVSLWQEWPLEGFHSI